MESLRSETLTVILLKKTLMFLLKQSVYETVRIRLVFEMYSHFIQIKIS